MHVVAPADRTDLAGGEEARDTGGRAEPSRTTSTSWSALANSAAPRPLQENTKRPDGVERRRRPGTARAPRAGRLSPRRRRAAGTARCGPTCDEVTDHEAAAVARRRPTMPRTRKSPCPCSSAYSSMAMPICSPREASAWSSGVERRRASPRAFRTRRHAGELEQHVALGGGDRHRRPDRAAALAHDRARADRRRRQDADRAAVERLAVDEQPGRAGARAARARGRRRTAGRPARRCDRSTKPSTGNVHGSASSTPTASSSARSRQPDHGHPASAGITSRWNARTRTPGSTAPRRDGGRRLDAAAGAEDAGRAAARRSPRRRSARRRARRRPRPRRRRRRRRTPGQVGAASAQRRERLRRPRLGRARSGRRRPPARHRSAPMATILAHPTTAVRLRADVAWPVTRPSRPRRRRPPTLGALRAAGHVHRSVKEEIRDNLLVRLRRRRRPVPRHRRVRRHRRCPSSSARCSPVTTSCCSASAARARPG